MDVSVPQTTGSRSLGKTSSTSKCSVGSRTARWNHWPQDTSCGLGIAPATVSEGPWHEHTNPQLIAVLRGLAGDGWHLLADSDEFRAYPAPLDQVLCDAEAGGGLLLARVAADGSLTGWNPRTGLDAAYPLGGFVTHRLPRGDPRKIVLAHHSVTVASGNHRAPGHRPPNRPPWSSTTSSGVPASAKTFSAASPTAPTAPGRPAHRRSPPRRPSC